MVLRFSLPCNTTTLVCSETGILTEVVGPMSSKKCPVVPSAVKLPWVAYIRPKPKSEMAMNEDGQIRSIQVRSSRSLILCYVLGLGRRDRKRENMQTKRTMWELCSLNFDWWSRPIKQNWQSGTDKGKTDKDWDGDEWHRTEWRENQRMSKRNLCLEFLWFDHHNKYKW